MGRITTILLLSILWFIGSSWWYTCKIKQVCAAVEVSPPKAEKVYGPLVFDWDKSATITNDAFPSYKSDILASLTDNNLLNIVGHYYDNEVNDSEYENMGLARANAVKALFVNDVPEERIKLSAKSLGASSEPLDDLFESADLSWSSASKKIVETANSTLIYFEFATDKEKVDSEITTYLKNVAERVNASGESILLTGHTDNVGGIAYNNTLGKRRANKVKAILTQLGVEAKKIKTSTMGESKPMASNDTQTGRDQNRRVELVIK